MLGERRRLGAALLVAVSLTAGLDGRAEKLAAARGRLARARGQFARPRGRRLVDLARARRELRARLARAVNALARRVGHVLTQLASRLRREQQRDERADGGVDGEAGQLRAHARVFPAPAAAPLIL